jgi:2-(1,2-epoxy-1,2-dihydrophenyl)acetyl-CoA isomerase
MELALLGNRFDAREALALGLVNRVVPDDAMEAALEEWTGHITEGPRLAYARTKALLYGSLDNSFEEQIALEEASFKECARTTDFAEGVAAFMEKRKAKFG